jgi:acetyl-CoA acetyltransferase
MSTSYVIDAARTPRGRGKAGKGALSHLHPQELLAQVLRALVARGSVRAAEVDDVIAGCVSQVGEQGANVTRNAVLAAGWPIEVSATTVNRFCGSGLQSVHFAAMGVASGAMDLAVAGGVESMSRVPMGSDGGGQDGNNLALRERFFQVPQGISADLIATLEALPRRELDALALRSQRNAARAIEENRFGRSLVPVVDPASHSSATRARGPTPAPKGWRRWRRRSPRSAPPSSVRAARRSTSWRAPATPPPPRSVTCTLPATRAGSPMAPAPWCSPPSATCASTESSRARASAP